MALPVSDLVPGASRGRCRAAITIAFATIALGGCSINLGSLYPDSDKTPAPKPAAANAENATANPVSLADMNQSQAATARGQTLARDGKIEEALKEFNSALELDPHNAQALYQRGLLYQGQQQHPQAVEDFTAANGLTPQRPEPLLARAISYLALDRPRDAAADLDEAAEGDPQNPQIWINRGLAYERLGNKTKAAESYGRALGLRPKDETARNGFARVGGKAG